MKGSDFDNILRNKVSEKEYIYSDEHWLSAKQFIDEKRASKRRWIFFFFSLAALTVAVTSYSIWPKNSSIEQNILTDNTIKKTNKSLNQIATNSSLTTIAKQPAGNPNSSTTTSIKSEQTSPNKNLKNNKHTQTTAAQELNKRETKQLGSTRIEVSNKQQNAYSALTKRISNQSVNTRNSLPTVVEQALISAHLPNNHRIKESPLFLSSTLTLTEYDETDIYIKSKSNKISRKKAFQIGTYAQFYLTEKTTDVKYTLENNQLWSAGVLGIYPLTKSISLQAGVGYQHQQFDLSFTQLKISNAVVNNVETTTIPVITTTQRWEYLFDFSGGVATTVDSIQVTEIDTSYITQYDTLETIVTDTSNATIKSNFVINSIEVPLLLNYSKPFGRWEFFGAAGIHLNYATSIKASKARYEQEMPSERQVKNFGLDASIQLGLSYIISPEIKLSLAPIYRVNATKRYEFIDRKSNYTGLTLSLLYRIK